MTFKGKGTENLSSQEDFERLLVLASSVKAMCCVCVCRFPDRAVRDHDEHQRSPGAADQPREPDCGGEEQPVIIVKCNHFLSHTHAAFLYYFLFFLIAFPPTTARWDGELGQ